MKSSIKIEPQAGDKVLICPHSGDETRLFEVVPETSLYPMMIVCNECKTKNKNQYLELETIIWGEGGEEFVEATIQ